MSSLEADKVVLTISILNSKFEVDSEHTKVSSFFTTLLEGASRVEGRVEGEPITIEVLKGMKNPEVAIEGIVQYMNITKGIRQDLVPQPLKEVVSGSGASGPVEKGMRAYVYKLRDTPAPEIVDEDDEEEVKKKCDVCNGGNKTVEAPPVVGPESGALGPEEPKNFELADFIDNYVEKNGMTGLYEMIGYSNFLGIKPLLYLCCAKMALMMKDKSLEEIKTLVESGL
jgi:Skp1 family, dimerisation domain